MKITARNAFHCTVSEVRMGGVNAEVILNLAERSNLAATITEESARNLDIHPGREVTALVKASFIMLASGKALPSISARNRIPGIVTRREDGAVNSEITLDIGSGKTLSAVVTRNGATELELQPGASAWALFKASHVILAVE